MVQSMSMASTIPLYPQRTFYTDPLLTVCLNRYPTTPGHAIAVCLGTDELMSMSVENFVDVFKTLRRLSNALISAVQAKRAGLVSDGSDTISVVPLHGLSDQWAPCKHDEMEYHVRFPGYLNSKNGPRLDNLVLTQTRDCITAVTGLGPVFNLSFDGPLFDNNLFARIVRGTEPHWCIWEDEGHVAFLTPYGNTPGYTVLVPRKHLPSDVFRLPEQAYVDLLVAAHTVAQHLKKAFGVARCGMFFEGYEVDYVHVKLVPVHVDRDAGPQGFDPARGVAPFRSKYEGYLTSQRGPLAMNQNELMSTHDIWIIILGERIDPAVAWLAVPFAVQFGFLNSLLSLPILPFHTGSCSPERHCK
ncbi:MAG: hypothetical protein M1826_006595 [Phylliscum demangeonii]|nr:MAG: hypothetical protein M1826_006595 [Phylliscum demangeonii]